MDHTIIHTLKTHSFDVLITDVADSCSRIISAMTNIPTVTYSSAGFTPDVSFPHIISMTPFLFSPELTDEMNFSERIANSIGFFLTHFVMPKICSRMTLDLVDKLMIDTKKSISDVYSDALVLAGTDFTFEFPRPYMPNIIPVGGWYIDSANPLAGKLKTFVDQSGDIGIVYLSFGTLFAKTYQDKMELLGRVFERFPQQRFVWKYNGPPISVPENVFQMAWVPQNDLLGHKKLRLFITHCGSHSSYEALYHGIPVVAIPLFVDQPSNAIRLVNRLNMGVMVDFRSMTEETLMTAIIEVINNQTYRDNAKKAQSLFRDQQTSPSSRVMYYIEYVIRHKSIGHLASRPLATLSFLQLWSIDVLTVLLLTFTVLLLILYILVKHVVKLFLICCNVQIKKQKSD